MRIAAIAFAFVVAAGTVVLAQAQVQVQVQAPSWPDRPIRWIVPYPAGGGTDIVARAVGDQLSQSLRQPVVVDNRGGGNTIIGTSAVAQSAPDGYTIGLITDAFSANVALGRSMPYDSERDFVPVIQLLQVPFVLIVNPEQVPMRTLPELIKYAKEHPGWLTAATLGPGSPHETAMSWFKSMAGIDMLLVPYRGGSPAIADLVSGQVRAMMYGVAAADEMIKAGKVVPIAVTSPARLQSAPTVPTIAEQGYPDFAFASWFGVHAPGKVPANIVQRLNAEINRALETKTVRDRIVTAGGEVVGGPPERMKDTIRESNERYRKIFSMTGTKPD